MFAWPCKPAACHVECSYLALYAHEWKPLFGLTSAGLPASAVIQLELVLWQQGAVAESHMGLKLCRHQACC